MNTFDTHFRAHSSPAHDQHLDNIAAAIDPTYDQHLHRHTPSTPLSQGATAVGSPSLPDFLDHSVMQHHAKMGGSAAAGAAVANSSNSGPVPPYMPIQGTRRNGAEEAKKKRSKDKCTHQ